jgi:hypothetical protein
METHWNGPDADYRGVSPTSCGPIDALTGPPVSDTSVG